MKWIEIGSQKLKIKDDVFNCFILLFNKIFYRLTLEDGQCGHWVHSRDERSESKTFDEIKFVDNICQTQ